MKIIIFFIFIDRKSGIMSSMESFRKKSRDDGSFVRHGSVERPRSASLDKRNSWSTNEDLAQAYDNFRPVTLTVSSFFKQVCYGLKIYIFEFRLNYHLKVHLSSNM